MILPGYHYYSATLKRVVFISRVKDGWASYERSWITEKGWIAHGNGRLSVKELTPLQPHIYNAPLLEDCIE